MAVEIALFGVPEFIAKLKNLGRVVGRAAIRKGLRAGAKIIHSSARQTVPRKTGALKASLRVRSGKQNREVERVVVITGKGFFKGDTYYGGFVHFGHRLGKRSLGNSRRMIPGKPFLKNAFDQNKDRVLSVVESTIKDEVEKASVK